MIEFYAEPAVVLSVGPSVKDRDARNCQFVTLDLRQLIDSNRLEAGLSYGTFQLLFQRARIVRGLYNERAGIELLPASFKRLFGGGNLHVLQLVPQSHQRIFSVVIDQISCRRCEATNTAGHACIFR